jgi:hypothetical protein
LNSQRKSTLRIELLESREVPAHNLTIVAGSTDSNILVGPGGGSTVTIFTKGNDAQLSLGTIQSTLQQANTQSVIITTDVKNGQQGSQPGNIVWDSATAGNLSLAGIGTGKSLTFTTVSGNSAVGNITLTGVQFQSSGNQLSLAFDSHDVNGAVTFQAGGSGTVGLNAIAVKDLTVFSGTGAFSYADGGTATPANVGGAVSITSGPVNLNLVNGLTALGPIAITASGSVTIANGTDVSASGDLTISATSSLTASNAALTASGGALSVAGTIVGLSNIDYDAPTGLTVTGTTSITMGDGSFAVGGPVALTGGTIGLTNVTLPTAFTVGDVTVNGTTVTMNNVTVNSARSISVTGTAINTSKLILTADGNVDVNGPVTAVSGFELDAGGNVGVTGSVNGLANATLNAGGTLTFSQDIGTTIGLNSLALVQGTMDLGTHNLTAGQVDVGQATGPVQATLGMNGTLQGNVTVFATGNLAPGGLGAVGIMNVGGNVAFNGGDFAVDFGASGAADKLLATGSVGISGGSQLGGGLGSGQVTGGLAIVINAGTTVSGTFANAAPTVPVLVGTDAVTATYTTNQVIVTPYTPVGGTGPTAIGVDDDGTGFKATLTGGGSVLTGTDWLGNRFLVARDTTASSKLAIVATANASSGIVTFPAGVLVSGPLAAFTAPAVNIGTQFRVASAVAAATFRDFVNSAGATGIDFGGTAAQTTSITARNVFGSIKTGATLKTLKVARSLGAQAGVPFVQDSAVSAAAIGKVTARFAATDFNTPGAIASIAIVTDEIGDISAASLAALTALSFNGSVTATGAVTSIKTTAAFNGTITAGSLAKFQAGGGFATIVSTGTVGSITGKGEAGLGLELSASQVGAIKVDGALVGDGLADGPDWNVVNGIASLTTGSLANVDIMAKFLGAVAVKGNPAFGLSGDVLTTNFTLTGNDGTSAKLGLKSLSAKGSVRTSRFDVQSGNVGAVTVGRFLNSQLYLNYTPSATNDFTLGSFGAGKFTLTSFKTTALPTADPANPLNWAFADSEICADTIGSVTLSGLKTANSGSGFGIKSRSAGTTVVVMKADVTNAPGLPLGTALTPDKTSPYAALAGDFFFLNV